MRGLVPQYRHRRFLLPCHTYPAFAAASTAAMAAAGRRRAVSQQQQLHSNGGGGSSDDDDDVCNDDDAAMEPQRATRQWVRRVVVGLNLCPFAEKPARERLLQIVTVRASMPALLPWRTVAEMERLVAAGVGTTLVVCPGCHPHDFGAYLTVLEQVQDAIGQREWDGVLQVAPFHPLFQFAGSAVTDPDNYTNRSPYPTFHLLLEADVAAAVQRLPNEDAAVVWSRNVDLLQTLQRELTAADFAAVTSARAATDAPPSLRQQLRQILRRFPIPLVQQQQQQQQQQTRDDDADDDDDDDNTPRLS
jgi:hypothetical protein